MASKFEDHDDDEKIEVKIGKISKKIRLKIWKRARKESIRNCIKKYGLQD